MNDQNFSDLLKMLVFASCIEMAGQGSKYKSKYSWHKNVFLFSVFFFWGGGGIKNKLIVVLTVFSLIFNCSTMGCCS